MKQQERASIVRLAIDFVRADGLVSRPRLECYRRLLQNYAIGTLEERAAQRLTLSQALSILSRLPQDLRDRIMDDVCSLAFAGPSPRREGALMLAAVASCLSTKTANQSKVHTIPTNTLLPQCHGQLIYVEGEYDKATNAGIEQNYGEICALLQAAGLEFVYLPKLRELCTSWREDLAEAYCPLFSYEAKDWTPEADDLARINTATFCREVLVGEWGLRSMEEAAPSLLMCIGSSSIQGTTHENVLCVELENDCITTIRHLSEILSELNRPRSMSLLMAEPKSIILRGHFDSAIRLMNSWNRQQRASVVVNLIRGEICLPELDLTLTHLHRREKALYALFLLEAAGGGINFSRPTNARTFEHYCQRMERIQTKYEKIYEGFGGNKAKAPQITQSTTLLPMLSVIKKQFRLISNCLHHPEDYAVKLNAFGNYNVAIAPELCLCFDAESMNVCRFEESSFWANVSAL